MYEYGTIRSVNPLCKKRSIMVLCGKLLKVLFTICTKQQAFDGVRMMQDVFTHV
ncbi:hypothetical protein HNR43_001368 [Anoxybacillus mongoliensis]|uniref:Transposase n=1 Tax=Anoxybacillus mongoliensis TaxID=452565 RepID=A0A7W8N6T3_9BACL|nr:hypothetical protein [Anoxybacillus mongoliensis]